MDAQDRTGEQVKPCLWCFQPVGPEGVVVTTTVVWGPFCSQDHAEKWVEFKQFQASNR